jgi:serine/threonine-protein kinase
MRRSFGAYEVLEQVAVGATGTVYRARQVELDRIVAIKELSAQLRDRRGFADRMRHEAAVLGALDHPNIVRIYDYVEQPDRAWIVEEWVNGASLATILDRHGRLTPEQAVGVLRGAMLGLAHAHQRDLVHHDIAPSNILADLAGTSKLVDFGQAAQVGSTSAHGTPAFISPEAIRGHAMGKSGDIYSAACVLYMLLAGQPPFAARDVAAMLQSHLAEPPPALQHHGPELQDLLLRSMSKDPSVRPQDAAAFLAELEEAAHRRFGAGWLERSSIAGLVALAGGGVAAAAGGSAAGPTVVLDAASVASHLAGRVARKAPKRIAGLTSGVAIGAVAVVAVVGAGAATYALTRGGDGDAPQTSTTVTQTPAQPTRTTTTPPPPTIDELTPTGVYTLRRTVVESDVPGIEVGQVERTTWRMKLGDCTATRCEGGIKSSSGNRFAYAWDGRTFRLEPVASESAVVQCIDSVTGKVTPGTSVRITTSVRFTALRAAGGSADGDAAPRRLTGSSTVRYSYSDYVDCTREPPHRAVYEMVLIAQ